jgi:hypothetical protein
VRASWNKPFLSVSIGKSAKVSGLGMKPWLPGDVRGEL